MMPNTTHSREYSGASGADDMLYVPQRQWQPRRPLPVLERRAVVLELQRARQRLERDEPVCGARNSLHFPPMLLGGFCFSSCPPHPPSILPIASIFMESAIYFVSSSDFVSQSIMRSSFAVSTFLIAARTNGSFSGRGRNSAVATNSILSTRYVSTLWPSECRWVLGRMV